MKKEISGIHPYTKAAGGIDALRSSAHALSEQDILVSGAKTMLQANQPKGFDCPGCAWPDRNHHSTFEFCENGVKAVANEATSKRVMRDFFAKHSVSELKKWSDYDLEGLGRLTEPMRYDSATDHYIPASWEQAFTDIAAHLNQLQSPDEAIFYTSGRTSNEAAFLYQLFVRQFGTNNLPDCSNMCHEPSGVSMTEQIGSGKGSVLLDDFEHAQALFIFGQNPGTNHPRMLSELRSAAKRGCAIVAINPLRERGLVRFSDPKSPVDVVKDGVKIASDYLQPNIGGDLAFLIGMAKHVIERNAVDAEFIQRFTQGYDAFKHAMMTTEWSSITLESGLSRKQIEHAADIYIKSEASIFCWGMGITQHKRSVATIQMMVNVLMLRGNIGKPGAGPCPVRGHSNVQGDRTMGIYEKMPEQFLLKLGQAFSFNPPRQHGYDTIASLEAMHAGKAKVFFAMGGNFACATPDTAYTHAALEKCELTAHVSTKLNRSHLVHGERAYILPCLGRTEIDRQKTGVQAVSVEDSMSMVHLSEGINLPASDALLSEPAIVARLAAKTLPESTTHWMWLTEDYARIRNKISEVVTGFEDFNTRVSTPGGFHLYHPNRERMFPTPSKRACFIVHTLDSHRKPDAIALNSRPSDVKHNVMTLMSMRSHDQYNTTIYGLNDRYRGVYGLRNVCFISQHDLALNGFKDGDHVDIISIWNGEERSVTNFRLVAYDIPVGCLAAYYPETNPLVPLKHHAERANTPASKSIPVYLRAHNASTTV